MLAGTTEDVWAESNGGTWNAKFNGKASMSDVIKTTREQCYKTLI
jgi:hypothetical protein